MRWDKIVSKNVGREEEGWVLFLFWSPSYKELFLGCGEVGWRRVSFFPFFEGGGGVGGWEEYLGEGAGEFVDSFLLFRRVFYWLALGRGKFGCF